MKTFSLLKIPALTVGLGALLFFAPSCKAQSEVNPDHFDGTDPWEIAAKRPVTLKTKPASAPASYQAKNKSAGSGASLQLTTVRGLSSTTSHNAVAVPEKRKPAAVRKSDKK